MRRGKKRRILALFLCFVMIFSLTVSSYAEKVEGEVPHIVLALENTATGSNGTEKTEVATGSNSTISLKCDECGYIEGHSKECSKYVPVCTCNTNTLFHAADCDFYVEPVAADVYVEKDGIHTIIEEYDFENKLNMQLYDGKTIYVLESSEPQELYFEQDVIGDLVGVQFELKNTSDTWLKYVQLNSDGAWLGDNEAVVTLAENIPSGAEIVLTAKIPMIFEYHVTIKVIDELKGQLSPAIELPETVESVMLTFVQKMNALPTVDEVVAFENAVDTFASANQVIGLDAELPEGALENYESAYESFAKSLDYDAEPTYPATELDQALSAAFTSAVEYYLDAMNQFDGDLESAVEGDPVYGPAIEKMYALMEIKEDIYNNGVATYALDDSLDIVEIPQIETVANDNVEVHIFNYGSKINDSKTINKNGMGWLPFVQPKSTYNNTTGKYQYTEMDGTAEEDGTNAPTMSRVLKNGYPSVLSNGETKNDVQILKGSLQYLFDTSKGFVKGSGTLEEYTLPEGVEYGTPASYQSMHFAAKDGDSRLFKAEGNYYVYDSSYNAAWFDSEVGQFEVYNATLVPSYVRDRTKTSESNKGNFLPFNEFTTGADGTAQIWDEAPNQPEVNGEKVPAYTLYGNDKYSRADVWFGMSASLDFYMPEDGLLDDEQMVFNFLGDDDVWLYIDDVLILDIGGRHGPLEGKINFATGDVVYKKQDGTTVETTLKKQYEAAYKELSSTSDQAVKIKSLIDSFQEKTIDGETYYVFENFSNHSFKFFYLERGGGVSNCKLEFNLDPLPRGSLTVEKQEENLNSQFRGEEKYQFVLLKQETEDGDTETSPIAGASFDLTDSESLGAADENEKNNNVTEESPGQYLTDDNGYFWLKGSQMATFKSGISTKDKIVVKEIIPENSNYVPSFKVVVNGEQKQTGESGDFDTNVIEIENPDDKHVVTFTNTWNTGDLVVSKSVTGKAHEDATYDIVVEIGEKEFPISIKDGESKTISDIPINLSYIVSESDPNITGYHYQKPLISLNDSTAVEVQFREKTVADGETVWTNAITSGEEMNALQGTIISGNNTVIITNRCKADLTITKNVVGEVKPDQSFRFQITASNGYCLIVVLEADQFVYNAGTNQSSASITIKDMNLDTYTVKEDTEWSWRYELYENDPSEKSVTLGASTSVSFTNYRKNKYWLDGETWCENIFNGDSTVFGTEIINGSLVYKKPDEVTE